MADPNVVNITSLTYASKTTKLSTTFTTVQVATSLTTQIIDDLIIANLTGTVVTATVAKIKSAASSVTLFNAVSIPPNQTLQIQGPIVLQPGDKLTALGSNANKVAVDSNYRTIT